MSTRQKNPFMISFSRKPVEYIERPEQTERILTTFHESPVTDQLFLIMGVRGSGKTVLMSSIANMLAEEKDWLVVRCTPTGDIVHTIASELYNSSKLHQMSVEAQFTIPFIGHVGISSSVPEETDLSRIDRVLAVLQQHGKKLLVTIDEVTNTPQMKEFASVFQILIGKERPIYFLGTGLYENIMTLQNEQNMTFLYRAPKIILGPLDMAAIAQSYKKILKISAQESLELAALTKGYSFAFQVLGYIYWDAMPVSSVSDILPEYDAKLSDSAYSKMWMEMSDMDRKVCRAIAASERGRTKDVRSLLKMDSSLFNVYRVRLKNRGIVNAEAYGRVAFALPRFAEFVQNLSGLYEI